MNENRNGQNDNKLDQNLQSIVITEQNLHVAENNGIEWSGTEAQPETNVSRDEKKRNETELSGVIDLKQYYCTRRYNQAQWN